MWLLWKVWWEIKNKTSKFQCFEHAINYGWELTSSSPQLINFWIFLVPSYVFELYFEQLFLLWCIITNQKKTRQLKLLHNANKQQKEKCLNFRIFIARTCKFSNPSSKKGEKRITDTGLRGRKLNFRHLSQNSERDT